MSPPPRRGRVGWGCRQVGEKRWRERRQRLFSLAFESVPTPPSPALHPSRGKGASQGLRQGLQLVGADAPAGVEAHLLVLLGVLVRPVAGAGDVAGLAV